MKYIEELIIMSKSYALFQEFETKNRKRNIKIFEEVLDDFSKEIGRNFNYTSSLDPIGKFGILKRNYVYDSKYCELFFQLLDYHNYILKHEIKDAIFDLSRLSDPNKNKELIKRLLHSPIIDDISFNGHDQFDIYSDRYGLTIYKLASKYFSYSRNSKKIREYISKSELPQHCHFHTDFLARLLPEFYSITALCSSYFQGYYYHSYSYDAKEDMIIDLCSNAVIPKEQFYNIFEPNEVARTLNKEYLQTLYLTDLRVSLPQEFLPPLKIALYQQYLDSIDYTGSLEDAPFEKKKRLK